MHFLLQPIDNQRFLKIIAINVTLPECATLRSNFREAIVRCIIYLDKC